MPINNRFQNYVPDTLISLSDVIALFADIVNIVWKSKGVIFFNIMIGNIILSIKDQILKVSNNNGHRYCEEKLSQTKEILNRVYVEYFINLLLSK